MVSGVNLIDPSYDGRVKLDSLKIISLRHSL